MKGKKNFRKWMGVKEKVHFRVGGRSFSEREIWWAAVGENVGIEINGKGERFSRPVVILRKLSSAGCLVVPLTSQKHKGSWYVHFNFDGKDEYAVLAQIRVIGAERLYRRMGCVSEVDYNKIIDGMRELYIKKYPQPRTEVGG